MRAHKSSRDKSNTLHFLYHNAYSHQTYRSGDIPQGAPSNKFA